MRPFLFQHNCHIAGTLIKSIRGLWYYPVHIQTYVALSKMFSCNWSLWYRIQKRPTVACFASFLSIMVILLSPQAIVFFFFNIVFPVQHLVFWLWLIASLSSCFTCFSNLCISCKLLVRCRNFIRVSGSTTGELWGNSGRKQEIPTI